MIGVADTSITKVCSKIKINKMKSYSKSTDIPQIRDLVLERLTFRYPTSVHAVEDNNTIVLRTPALYDNITLYITLDDTEGYVIGDTTVEQVSKMVGEVQEEINDIYLSYV